MNNYKLRQQQQQQQQREFEKAIAEWSNARTTLNNKNLIGKLLHSIFGKKIGKFPQVSDYIK